MYILKIILGILALVVVYTIIRTYLLIKKSEVLVAQTHKYERVVPQATSTFLFLGDSTAVGTGSVEPQDTVAGRFGKEFPSATIQNEGINGQKIHQLAMTLASRSPEQVDLLVIQIGANDIIRFTPLGDVRKDLDTVLEKSQRMSKKVVILHSGNVGAAPFFPYYLGWIWTWRTRVVRDIYLEETKKYGIPYVDLFEERKNDPFLTDTNKYYAPDGLHLTGDGYAEWFKKIQETLGKDAQSGK